MKLDMRSRRGYRLDRALDHVQLCKCHAIVMSRHAKENNEARKEERRTRFGGQKHHKTLLIYLWWAVYVFLRFLVKTGLLIRKTETETANPSQKTRSRSRPTYTEGRGPQTRESMMGALFTETQRPSNT